MNEINWSQEIACLVVLHHSLTYRHEWRPRTAPMSSIVPRILTQQTRLRPIGDALGSDGTGTQSAGCMG
jgi:hypothetical protein